MLHLASVFIMNTLQQEGLGVLVQSDEGDWAV